MRIGEGSGNGAAVQGVPSGNGNSQDGRIQSIQKQIKNVQEQMKKLNDNQELSPEEKTERKKGLQQQLQDLNKQLTQRQMDIRREAQEKRAQEAEKLTEQNGPQQKKAAGGLDGAAMQNMIRAEGAMKQVQTERGVSAKLEGKAGVLKSEIKLDSSRGGSTTAKEAELAKMEGKISQVNADVMSRLETLNQDVHEAEKEKTDGTKTEKEKADDTRTEKEKEDEKNGRTGQTDQDAGIQTAGNAAGAEAQSAAAYMPIDVRI